MRSSFTKTKNALFKSNTSQSVDKESALEEDKEQKISKKSKKTESKSSFRQISNLFRIKKHRGRSSSNLPDDILKERHEFSRNRSQLLSVNEANESKLFDRSFSYSDIKIKAPEGTCFIDSDKYLIVDERRQPMHEKHHKTSVDNNSFIRHRKAQLSMRKAFGIYDEITSPDLICDLETTLTHSSSTITTSNHSLEQPPSPQLPQKKRPHSSSKCASIDHNEVSNYKQSTGTQQYRLQSHQDENHHNITNDYDSAFRKSEAQTLKYNDLNSKSMLPSNNSSSNNNTSQAFDSSLLTYENSYASYKSRNSLPHSLYYTAYSRHNYNLNRTAPLTNPLDQSNFLNHTNPMNHPLKSLNENPDSNTSFLLTDSKAYSETSNKQNDVGLKESYKVDDYPTLKADTYAEQLRKRLSFSHNSSTYHVKSKHRTSVDHYAYKQQMPQSHLQPFILADMHAGTTQHFFSHPLTHNTAKAEETHFELNEPLENKHFQGRSDDHHQYNDTSHHQHNDISHHQHNASHHQYITSHHQHNTCHQLYNDTQLSKKTSRPDYRRSVSVIESSSSSHHQPHGMYMYPNYKNTPLKPGHYVPLTKPQHPPYHTQHPQPKQRKNKGNKHNACQFDNLPDLTNNNTTQKPLIGYNNTTPPSHIHPNHPSYCQSFNTTKNISKYDDDNNASNINNTQTSIFSNKDTPPIKLTSGPHVATDLLHGGGERELKTPLIASTSNTAEYTADNHISTSVVTTSSSGHTSTTADNEYLNTTTTDTQSKPPTANPVSSRTSIFEKKYKPIHFTASLVSHYNIFDTTNNNKDKMAHDVTSNSTTFDVYNDTSNNNHSTTQASHIGHEEEQTADIKDMTAFTTTIATNDTNDILKSSLEVTAKPEIGFDKKREIEVNKVVENITFRLSSIQVSKPLDKDAEKMGGVQEFGSSCEGGQHGGSGEGGNNGVEKVPPYIKQTKQQLDKKVKDATESCDKKAKELNGDVKREFNSEPSLDFEMAEEMPISKADSPSIELSQDSPVSPSKVSQKSMEWWYIGRQVSGEEEECDKLMMKMSLKLQHNNEYLSKIFHMHLNLPSLFIDSQHLINDQALPSSDKEKTEEDEEGDDHGSGYDLEKDKMKLEEMLVVKLETLRKKERCVEEEVKDNLLLYHNTLKEIEGGAGERVAGKFASWWVKMDNMVKLMMKLKMMLMRNSNALHTLPSNSSDADKELLLKKSCDLKEKIREANIIRLDLQQEYHTWVQGLQERVENCMVCKAELCVRNKCRHSVQLDDLQSRLHTTQAQLQSLRNTMHKNSVGSLC